MKTIGFAINRDKDINLKYTKELIRCITEMGGEVRLPMDVADILGLNDKGFPEEEIFNGSDLIISLGGDGTFLQAARKAMLNDIPMLGVNLGTLGFLAEIDKNGIQDAIKKLFNHEYSIEERMLLETSVINGEKTKKDFALNDIVISRGALSRIVHVKAYINDLFVDSFPGDGLIISTPTGSTAYSLSAGGPIVEPDVDLIILTPICPHILYSRPIITTGERIVKITVDDNYGNAMMTVDGQKGCNLAPGDVIEINKSERRLKIARVYSRNYFNVLRSKIYERGECFRRNEI